MPDIKNMHRSTSADYKNKLSLDQQYEKQVAGELSLLTLVVKQFALLCG